LWVVGENRDLTSNRGHGVSGRVPKILKNYLRKGKDILTGWGFLGAWIVILTVTSLG
jgi:hypothetical protein